MIKYMLVFVVFIFSVSTVMATPGIFNDKKIKEFCNEYPKDEICIKLDDLNKDDPKYSEKKQQILKSLSTRTNKIQKEFRSIQDVLNQVEEKKSTEEQQ